MSRVFDDEGSCCLNEVDRGGNYTMLGYVARELATNPTYIANKNLNFTEGA